MHYFLKAKYVKGIEKKYSQQTLSDEGNINSRISSVWKIYIPLILEVIKLKMYICIDTDHLKKKIKMWMSLCQRV